MGPFDIVPANFSLTDRAANEISRLTRHPSKTEGKAIIAAFLWNEAYEEVEDRLTGQGFVLGWYELSEAPIDTVQKVNGIELLFVVTEQQAENFRGRIIDLVDGKLRFC